MMQRWICAFGKAAYVIFRLIATFIIRRSFAFLIAEFICKLTFHNLLKNVLDISFIAVITSSVDVKFWLLTNSLIISVGAFIIKKTSFQVLFFYFHYCLKGSLLFTFTQNSRRSLSIPTHKPNLFKLSVYYTIDITSPLTQHFLHTSLHSSIFFICLNELVDIYPEYISNLITSIF